MLRTELAKAKALQPVHGRKVRRSPVAEQVDAEDAGEEPSPTKRLPRKAGSKASRSGGMAASSSRSHIELESNPVGTAREIGVCGTGGCLLPAKHSGLCQVADPGKRRASSWQQQECEGEAEDGSETEDESGQLEAMRAPHRRRSSKSLDSQAQDELLLSQHEGPLPRGLRSEMSAAELAVRCRYSPNPGTPTATLIP